MIDFSFIKDIYLANPWAQSIGLIGYAISVYTFAFCKNKKFIFFMAILSCFWALHFYLIGAMTAFIVNFLDIFKAIFALKFDKNKLIASIFLLLYTFSWFIFYENFISLFPILLAIFWLYLTFFVRGIWLNLWYLISIVFWFIYNLYHGSIGGVISDITLFISGTYWIITMFLLKEKKLKK